MRTPYGNSGKRGKSATLITVLFCILAAVILLITIVRKPTDSEHADDENAAALSGDYITICHGADFFFGSYSTYDEERAEYITNFKLQNSSEDTIKVDISEIRCHDYKLANHLHLKTGKGEIQKTIRTLAAKLETGLDIIQFKLDISDLEKHGIIKESYTYAVGEGYAIGPFGSADPRDWVDYDGDLILSKIRISPSGPSYFSDSLIAAVTLRLINDSDDWKIVRMAPDPSIGRDEIQSFLVAPHSWYFTGAALGSERELYHRGIDLMLPFEAYEMDGTLYDAGTVLFHVDD
ncbi:MAG: hypothetical protein IKF42_00550 [Mogibacterium sp.]|nr:hypothetical protein [Mogibacterium sp.]